MTIANNCQIIRFFASFHTSSVTAKGAETITAPIICCDRSSKPNFSGIDFKPEKNDFIITKNTYDAFTNKKLDNILRKHKIRYVVVTGIFADGCVHSTIQGGFSAGYNFIILKDLIETTDIEIRQRLQNMLKDYTWPVLFGKTINSKEFFGIVE